MSHIPILPDRTVKTNIILYKEDGDGRDGFISYNNGGFWKDNIKTIKYKERFYRPSFAIYKSLKLPSRASFYFNDGTGRDGYISHDSGGNVKLYESLVNQQFLNLFRSKNEYHCKKTIIALSKGERIYYNKLNKMQKNLIRRLYEPEKIRSRNNISKRLTMEEFDGLSNFKCKKLYKSSSQNNLRSKTMYGKFPGLNMNNMSNLWNKNKNLGKVPNLKCRKFSENKFQNPYLLKFNTINNNLMNCKRYSEINKFNNDNKKETHPKVKCSIYI